MKNRIVKKKFLILTFDLEEFVTPHEVGMNIGRKTLFQISLGGFLNIIKLLKKHPKIKCTFFSTYEFAKIAQKQISILIKEGHEIALHGLTHNTNLNNMDYKDLKKELFEAKRKLEKLFNHRVYGFRSPQMKKFNFNVLSDIGISYDSSIHPTYIPGRNNYFFAEREAKFKNKLLHIPVSVTPVIRLPFSWIWFRNMGLWYTKLCSRMNLLDQEYICLYFHPWDFINIDVEPFKKNIMKFIIRNSGDKMIKKFDKYLTWCENNYESITMEEYLRIKNVSK